MNRRQVVRDHGKLREIVDGKGMCIDANYSSCPDNHGQRTMIMELFTIGNAEKTHKELTLFD